MNFTVEQTSRILSRLNVNSFTASSTQRLLENNKLKRVQRPNNCFNTAYNYVVDGKSLEDFLVNELKLDSNEVSMAIYGGRKW
ncbi:hypothetical protein [Staphylococcus aureus]|uniref:hypothetical protein n=1 Tax=Staphylococcus aureus TaxID=1280 RepID=UPI0030F43964